VHRSIFDAQHEEIGNRADDQLCRPGHNLPTPLPTEISLHAPALQRQYRLAKASLPTILHTNKSTWISRFQRFHRPSRSQAPFRKVIGQLLQMYGELHPCRRIAGGSQYRVVGLNANADMQLRTTDADGMACNTSVFLRFQDIVSNVGTALPLLETVRVCYRCQHHIAHSLMQAQPDFEGRSSQCRG
jgi:hypothetical protein